MSRLVSVRLRGESYDVEFIPNDIGDWWFVNDDLVPLSRDEEDSVVQQLDRFLREDAERDWDGP